MFKKQSIIDRGKVRASAAVLVASLLVVGLVGAAGFSVGGADAGYVYGKYSDDVSKNIGTGVGGAVGGIGGCLAGGALAGPGGCAAGGGVGFTVGAA